MKHLLIFLILITSCIIDGAAQDITFTFLGENSFNQTSMIVDSIKITNNTNGTDTLVHDNIFSFLITSIDLISQNNSPEIITYPNPFNNAVNIILHSKFNEQVKVGLYTVDGKKINEWSNFIGIGTNNLLLNSHVKGVLFLTIISPNLRYHSKLLCTKASAKSELQFVNNSHSLSANQELKSNETVNNTFEFSLGDSLTFTGYSNDIKSDFIHDKPAGNKTYTFNFDVTDYLPVADFSVSTQNTNQGNSINFIDLSTSNPTAWNWDFGDGNTSTVQNPTHSYLTPGTYTVTLSIENKYGSDTIIKQNFITINSSEPVADFSANTTTIDQGDEIIFTDQSTNTPTSWVWDFGDGDTSTVQHPSHTYLTAGTYSVKLTVSNSFGSDSIIKQNYITVNSYLPTADFTANVTLINEDEEVIFTDKSTNSPLSWEWEFGDGNISNIQHPSHIYSVAGIYSVKLIATNSFGSDTIVKPNYIEVLSNTNPELSISPTSLDFDTISTQKYISINNIGGGILSWSVSENINWLTVNMQSGETTQETDQLAVTVNRTDLPAGDYFDKNYYLG